MSKKYLDSSAYLRDMMSVDSYHFVGEANMANPNDVFTVDECLFTAANKARLASDRLEAESVRYPKEKKRYDTLIKSLRRRESFCRSLEKQVIDEKKRKKTKSVAKKPSKTKKVSASKKKQKKFKKK